MKSKFLQFIFYLDVYEEEGYFISFWHIMHNDYKNHCWRSGSPNRVQCCGSGHIFINLELVFDKKFAKPNKFMQFSKNYDFRKVTPFTARLAK